MKTPTPPRDSATYRRRRHASRQRRRHAADTFCSCHLRHAAAAYAEALPHHAARAGRRRHDAYAADVS